jgi:hypothetical protein
MTSKHYDVNGLNGTVELGKGGPKIVDSSGTIEARDQAGTAFAKLRAGHPVDANDVVTLRYLQTKGAVVVLDQINGGGSIPSASPAGRVFVCTTTGAGYTVKNLYYANGSTWEEVVPSEGLSIAVTDDLSGGTLTFTADHSYLWDADGSTWIDLGPSTATSLAKITKTREVALVFGSSASVNVGTVIPIYGRILRVCINVTQAFNGTAPTVTVGDGSDADRFMTAIENNLKATGCYWIDTFYMMPAETQILAAYVADSSSQGAATIFVEWSEA